jgi:type III restriction enzyme
MPDKLGLHGKEKDDAKIECARKFFASLNEKQGQDVKYDVATDYAELMQLVAG